MTWRNVALAAFLFGAVGAWGQAGVATAIGKGLKSFIVSLPAKKNPLEPSGFPTLPPREGQLPPARPFGADEREFQIVESGQVMTRGKRVVATGGIHARYKGYDFFGSTLEGDHDTEIYTLSGDVKVIGQDAVVTGRKVTVFMKTESFIAEDADSQLRPSFLKGKVLDDVYLRGARLDGTQREVHSHDGGITTCNLPHPHFEIRAESTTIRPTKRAILRKVKVIILGKKIFELPYLSIPLEERSDRYLPEVGRSDDEGYFIRFKYPIPLKGNHNFLDARLAYMTKLGTEIGADFTYDRLDMRGTIRTTGRFGPQGQSMEVVTQHSQNLGSVRIDVSNNFQRQSYLLAPENTLLNSVVSLNWSQATGQTGLSYYRASNDGSSFKYLQQTLTLNDTRNFGRSTRWDISMIHSSNSSSFSGGTDVKREQLDLQMRGTHDMKAGTAELEYRRSIPIGEVENFFGSADRTPVLSFRSTSERILGSRFREYPVQINFSLGEYTQPGQQQERLSRGALELAFAKSTTSGRLTTDLGGTYKQGVYSDGTAQYIKGANGGFRYGLGRGVGLNFRYNFLEPHGFTPFNFDRSGEYNLATMDLSFNPTRTTLLGAQTGYDFRQEQAQQTAWQSVGVRSEWTPAPWFRLRSLSTYDTFNKGWSNVRLDLAWEAGATRVGFGARYDGFRHTWGNVNIFVDGFKWGRLKTSALLVYNGYLEEFEARHFSFTYDLHCAEAILQIIDNPTGFRSGTQISFFIRLKALPFDTPFGTGRRGQSFGTGTGFGF